MMSKHNSRDGLCEARLILGDVTNRTKQRTISMASKHSISKSGDGHVRNGDNNYCDSVNVKQVYLRAENLLQKPDSVESTNVRADTAVSILEAGDASRDSCVSIASKPTCPVPCAVGFNGIGTIIQEDKRYCTNGVVVHRNVSDINICENRCKDPITDNLTSNKRELGSKLFELERCILSKGDSSSNSSANLDLIKTCSCSFCMKAGYILADLHYQDIKGRIAVSNKSQKEASALVQSCCRLKESNTHDHGTSNKSSKLEQDLMGQWRSLFLFMEGTFVGENTKLEESFRALKDLRENCKTNSKKDI